MTQRKSVSIRRTGPVRLQFDRNEPAALVTVLACHASGERKLRILLTGGEAGDRYFLARRLANEMRMDLLELMVSKYIGDTEKSLRELILKAAREDTILFIDEADVLFTKSGAARSANTRAGRQTERILRAVKRYPKAVVFSARGWPGPVKALERLVHYAVTFCSTRPVNDLDRPRTTQNFRIVVGTSHLGFCFVSALTSESETDGAESAVGTRHRFARIVLRRAISGARDLFQWRDAIVRGEKDYRDVLIQLLDGPGGEPFASWRLHDAWPVRWSGPVLDGLEPVIATEEIELKFKRLTWV